MLFSCCLQKAQVPNYHNKRRKRRVSYKNRKVRVHCISPNLAFVRVGKNAAVVPIRKSSPRNIVLNYRTLFLNCVVCKISERVLYTSIVQHVKVSSLLNAWQYGFRERLSCVVQLTEFLSSCWGTGYETYYAFLDFGEKEKSLWYGDPFIQKLISNNINVQTASY